MRKALPFGAGTGLMLGLAACTPVKNRIPDKPNILFLLADDQRYNTIHELNCPEVATPNMDLLARQGLVFTHAHIMGGTCGAVCMPSRAMLLTSKSLFRLKDKGRSIPDQDIMFPEYLRKNGYTTFGTGKWHNGRKAFARCFSDGGKIFFGGMSNHLKVPVNDFDPEGVYPKKRQYIGEKFSSELFADAAIQFLDNYKGENPFLCYVAFTAPHDPRMAPKEYADRYTTDNVSVPENFLPQHPFDNGELRIRDEMLAPFPRTPEIIKYHLGAYYAMITHLDNQIGRILEALKRDGFEKKTIIIFTADNGLAIGSHGLMGKQNVYDHSVRVPLIIKGRGIPKAHSSTLCYLNDLFPTICDITGLPVPGSVESKSLFPVIDSPGTRIHDYAFYAYRNYQRGIRTAGNWKLIRYQVNGSDTLQLFNLNADPLEMHNLGTNPEYRQSVKDLNHLMHNAMIYFGDTLQWIKKL